MLSVFFQNKGLITKKKTRVMLVVTNPPANAGDARDVGSIPGLGRSPGGRHGYPLQYSYLENPIDRGAWQLQFLRLGSHT